MRFLEGFELYHASIKNILNITSKTLNIPYQKISLLHFSFLKIKRKFNVLRYNSTYKQCVSKDKFKNSNDVNTLDKDDLAPTSST